MSKTATRAKAIAVPMNSATVKFNVGGCLYEVSQDLLQSFPLTMLARMMSKTWQKDPAATLFVECDGERLCSCLDHMRDGKVWLPFTAPKEAFLQDLNFHGLEDVDKTKIRGGNLCLKAAESMLKCKNEHDELMSLIKAEMELVVSCFKQGGDGVRRTCLQVLPLLQRGESLKNMTFDLDSSAATDDRFCDTFTAIVVHDKQSEFQDHLEKQGLGPAHLECSISIANRQLVAKLKKKEETSYMGGCIACKHVIIGLEQFTPRPS
jgi:hypothetical protein